MAEGFDAGAVVGRMILAHDELGKSLAEIKKQVAAAGKESEKATDKASTGWQKFGKALKAISFAVIAKKIWDFSVECVKAFAEVDERIRIANNYLKQYGTSWDEVKQKSRAAVEGTLSDSELLLEWNKALTIGLNPDQIVEMLEVSKKLSEALGMSVPDAMDALMTAGARMSDRMLKPMGIMVDLDEANKKYADSIGVTVKQLSDQEKKQVAVNAVLEAAKAKVGEMGDIGDPAADRLDRVASAWENIKVAAGSVIEGLGISEALSWWAALAQQLADWLDQAVKNFVKFKAEMAGEEVISEKRTSAAESAAEAEKLRNEAKSRKELIEDTVEPGPGEIGWVNLTPEEKAAEEKIIKGLEDRASILEHAAAELEKQASDLEKTLYGEPPPPPKPPKPPKPPVSPEKEDPTVKAAEDALAELREIGRDDVERIENEWKERNAALEAGELTKDQIEEGHKLNDKARLEDYRELAKKRVDILKKEAEDKADMLDLSYRQQEQALEAEYGDRDDYESRRLELEAQRLQDQTALYESEYKRQLELLQQTVTDKDMLREEEAALEAEHTRKLQELGLEQQRISQAKVAAMRAEKDAKVELYSDIAMTGIDLFMDNEKEAAKLKGWIEIAEGTRTGAQWIEAPWKGNLLLSSLQHFLAAKQYFKAASSAGAGAGKSSGGGGGGGGGGKGDKDKNKPGKVEEGENAGPAVNLIVNFHGAALLDETQLNDFVVNQFSPAVEKLAGAGRLSQSWTKK